MRIDYNAPFTLTFSLLCVAVLMAAGLTGGWVLEHVFSINAAASLGNPLTWPRLFLHVLGHAGPEHLFFNLMFLLLVGPMLEKQYGSLTLVLISSVTAVVTGLIMVLFFKGLLLGASGVVFACIILSSFANARSGTIPLTFVMVALIFLGHEIHAAFSSDDNIARFAHIAGGVIGGLTGFLCRR